VLKRCMAACSARPQETRPCVQGCGSRHTLQAERRGRSFLVMLGFLGMCRHLGKAY